MSLTFRVTHYCVLSYRGHVAHLEDAFDDTER